MQSNEWMTSGEGHPRRWPILAVLVVSLLVVVLDNTVLNIALPTIQKDLGATQSELVWAIDSYILVFASLLFTWGILGDKYGRKKVLVIGLVIFGLASAACAFAATPLMLIVFRAVMGIGGAAVLPTTLAIITVVFPPHERPKAIAIWAGLSGAGAAFGPVASGYLLEHFWWGSVFLVNIPIGVLGFLFGFMYLEENKEPNAGSFDIPGFLLAATGLATLLYALSQGPDKGWLSGPVLSTGIAGVVLLSALIRVEMASPSPMLYLRLYSDRMFRNSNMVNTFSYGAFAAFLFLLLVALLAVSVFIAFIVPPVSAVNAMWLPTSAAGGGSGVLTKSGL